MALEYKTLNVKNSAEDATVRYWTMFGWQLQSSQRVYNKDSHLESRGDSTYSVTETVDFTKLVFQRDKNMPNYKDICRLEAEYLSTEAKVQSFQEPTSIKSYSDIESYAKEAHPMINSKNWIFVLIAVAGIAFALFAGFCFDNMALSAVGFIGGIAVTVIACIVSSKQNKAIIAEALDNRKSETFAKLQKRYDEHCNNANKYADIINEHKANQRRLAEIINELEDLI